MNNLYAFSLISQLPVEMGKCNNLPNQIYECHAQKNYMCGAKLVGELFLYLNCKICVKRSLSKRPKIGFQDQSSLNMLNGGHSAILSTSIKLHVAFVINKIFVFVYYLAVVLHRFYCK